MSASANYCCSFGVVGQNALRINQTNALSSDRTRGYFLTPVQITFDAIYQNMNAYFNEKTKCQKKSTSQETDFSRYETSPTVNHSKLNNSREDRLQATLGRRSCWLHGQLQGIKCNTAQKCSRSLRPPKTVQ